MDLTCSTLLFPYLEGPCSRISNIVCQSLIFRCPVWRVLSLTDPNRYAMRVSPSVSNRIVDAARSILNQFLPDIYIYTDHMKGPQSGK